MLEAVGVDAIDRQAIGDPLLTDEALHALRRGLGAGVPDGEPVDVVLIPGSRISRTRPVTRT